MASPAATPPPQADDGAPDRRRTSPSPTSRHTSPRADIPPLALPRRGDKPGHETRRRWRACWSPTRSRGCGPCAVLPTRRGAEPGCCWRELPAGQRRRAAVAAGHAGGSGPANAVRCRRWRACGARGRTVVHARLWSAGNRQGLLAGLEFGARSSGHAERGYWLGLVRSVGAVMAWWVVSCGGPDVLWWARLGAVWGRDYVAGEKGWREW